MDDGEDIRPGWQMDGKGIAGDTTVLNFRKLDFPSASPILSPSAQVDRQEAETSVGGPMLRDQPFSGGSGLSKLPDFSLYDAGSGNLGITNGTVAGPSFAPAFPTGGSPAMVAGGSPPALFPVSGSGFAWLKITWTGITSGSTVTAVEIDTGLTVPTNTTTAQYISLGDYNNTGSAIAIGSGVVGIGSQTVQICNGAFQP
jgi:hypothetical protein